MKDHVEEVREAIHCLCVFAKHHYSNRKMEKKVASSHWPINSKPEADFENKKNRFLVDFEIRVCLPIQSKRPDHCDRIKKKRSTPIIRCPFSHSPSHRLKFKRVVQLGARDSITVIIFKQKICSDKMSLQQFIQPQIETEKVWKPQKIIRTFLSHPEICRRWMLQFYL